MKCSFSSEELGKSKKPKYPSLTITDAFGINPEPEPSTSTIISSTAHPTSSVGGGVATASVPSIHGAGVPVSFRSK